MALLSGPLPHYFASEGPGRPYHRRIEVARDITQRKKSERSLVEQAYLLDLSGDAILVRDAQDRIFDWNKAAERMYGFTREEALGKISHELLRTEFPEPLPAIREPLLRDGRWSGELRHLRRAGPESSLFRAGLRSATTRKR